MGEIASYLFGATSFMPHGYCLLWRPDLVAMHAISDALIFAAYFSIPVALAVFSRRRADLEFRPIFILFALFILACGVAHLVGAVTLWQPVYGLQGLIKAVTALVSLAAAVAVWKVMPEALALPSPAQLRRQIDERRLAEGQLQLAYQSVEQEVVDRTRQLSELNRQLEDEVAQRRASQEALARSEERYRSLATVLTTVVWTADARGSFVEAQTGWHAYTGQSWHEHQGFGWLQAVHPDDRAGIEKLWQEALAHEEAVTAECRLWSAVHQTHRHVIVKAVPIVAPDGTVAEWVGTIADDDDRRQALGDLQNVNAVLKQQADELARSNQDLEQFAYVASHDLKAPLRAIDEISSWIEEDLAGVLEGETQANLVLLRKRVKRMEHLLQDLLDYSRIGRRASALERVSIGEVAESTIGVVRLPDGFQVVIECDVPEIETARVPLEVVLRNLIGNAIKHHAHDQGLITVTARERSEFCEIVVADDGPGIRPEHRERVFGLFQTLRSRDEVEGSGMGLAVVKRQVEAVGGRIWIADVPDGRGTEVHFTWPKVWPAALIKAPEPAGALA